MMEECDAVLILTSRGLLPKVLKSIKNCPNMKKIVYFSELHTDEEDSTEASDEIKAAFERDGRELYSFGTLEKYGDTNSTSIKSINLNF